MADPREIDVELSERLYRLRATALKGGMAAPLALKAARLAKLASDQEPVLGDVGPLEVLSALVLSAPLEGTEANIGAVVAAYRRTKTWELRKELGEETAQEGVWTVELPRQGQQFQ